MHLLNHPNTQLPNHKTTKLRVFEPHSNQSRDQTGFAGISAISPAPVRKTPLLLGEGLAFASPPLALDLVGRYRVHPVQAEPVYEQLHVVRAVLENGREGVRHILPGCLGEVQDVGGEIPALLGMEVPAQLDGPIHPDACGDRG